MECLTSKGSCSSMRRALFPDGFAGEVMSLIHETWRNLAMHRGVRHEEPITALLADALVNEYERRGWPWFIIPEVPVSDSTFGTELGRNDIVFYHRNLTQRIFFAVECKRLHVQSSSGFKHLVDKYVDEGLLRFVDSKYCTGLPCGGMVGYVMDGDMKTAFGHVQSEILLKRETLKMKSVRSLLIPSSVLKNCSQSADTVHDREDGQFLLHHLFLPCKLTMAIA